MGTKYYKQFTPFLELFEPRTAYISELRLQHAWKNALWMSAREDSKGRTIRILSPGRHNHSDGPDFIDARIMLHDPDHSLHGRAPFLFVQGVEEPIPSHHRMHAAS